MAKRAEYVKHASGEKLTKGTVLVFNDYFEVLDSKLGYVYRTDPLSGVKSKEKVKFRVKAYNRDGSGGSVHTREYRLHMEFPVGKLVD